MSDDLTVSKHETGTVRVFALNVAAEEQSPWKGGDVATIAGGLGIETVDPDYVDFVKPSDLEPLSLTDYLTEGYGLPAVLLAADAARLNALLGPVLVVLSRAFGGREFVLEPDASLTLIGTYREAPPVPPMDKLPSESAVDFVTEAFARQRADKVPRRRPGFGAIVLGILALILLWVYIGGLTP